MPNVSVIVCDDIRLEINGKLMLIGVYTGNILISEEQFVVPQIHFLFSIDCPRADIPQKVIFEVELPGGAPPQRSEIGVSSPTFQEGHTRWMMRHVVGFHNVLLTPGKVEARVLLDDQSYPAAAAWIEKLPVASETPDSDPAA